MSDFISMVMYSVGVVMEEVGEAGLFRFGNICIAVTVLSIIVWYYSYTTSVAEANELSLHDLYPSTYEMKDLEVNKMEKKKFRHELSCLLAYSIAILSGSVSIVYLLSFLLRR